MYCIKRNSKPDILLVSDLKKDYNAVGGYKSTNNIFNLFKALSFKETLGLINIW